MEQPDGGRVVALDALRGTAALLVLGAHANQLGFRMPGRTEVSLSGFVLHSMGGGVHLFFALSGFLIAGPWLRALIDGTPLPNSVSYATRRAARILPAYWFAFGALLVLTTTGAMWWQIPVHALLLQSVVPGESTAVYFVGWTLGLEAVFYVAVPLIARAIRRRHPQPIAVDVAARWLIGAWLVIAVVDVPLDSIVVNSGPRSMLGVVTSVSTGLMLFIPGMLVCLAMTPAASARRGVWAAHRWLTDRPVLALAAAGGAFIAGRAVFMVPDPVVALRAMPLQTVFSGLVLGVVVRWNPVGRLSRLLASAGTISYGLYLWHWVVVSALVERRRFVPLDEPGPTGYVVHLLLVLGISIVLAVLSWRLVERPSMRLAAGWVRTRTRREPRTIVGLVDPLTADS